MNKKQKISFGVAVLVAIIVATGLYLHSTNVQVLNPKGPVALAERNLIVLVLLLSLFVVIPVFTALILFSLRYREGNPHKATYAPDWDHSRKIETVWWLFPTILIVILSVITWRSTQELTPSRPLVSKNAAITIQVVALDWKWLFLYPAQHIATVNYIMIPKNVPVDFQITADAPMNSFWIPQLGGQIYAMPGMTTQLNLMASQTGNFRGLSANISGDGFSKMDFTAKSVTQQTYKSWVYREQHVPSVLSSATYKTLAQPAEAIVPHSYGDFVPGLFDSIIDKYMLPGNSQMQEMTSMQGMTAQ